MDEQQWMQPLTTHIRGLVQQRHFSEAENEAAQAMAISPHAAQPHNLMGIVNESRGDHVQAMKHFRAAWALDPTFLPARVNMERYLPIHPAQRQEAMLLTAWLPALRGWCAEVRFGVAGVARYGK